MPSTGVDRWMVLLSEGEWRVWQRIVRTLPEVWGASDANDGAPFADKQQRAVTTLQEKLQNPVKVRVTDSEAMALPHGMSVRRVTRGKPAPKYSALCAASEPEQEQR